jgi:hypothetical protein
LQNDLEIDFQRFTEDPGQADLKGRVRLGVVLAERYQPLRALAKQRPVKNEGGEIAPAQGDQREEGDDELARIDEDGVISSLRGAKESAAPRAPRWNGG